MPRIIIHHEGFFLEWSTVVDAPVTFGMPRMEFEDYYLHEYGRNGMLELPARLDRAVLNGTSAMKPESAESLTRGNRAGPSGESIPFEEIFRTYCLERPVERCQDGDDDIEAKEAAPEE